MSKFVRSFLGAHWQPEWVELNYRRDPLAYLLERELHCPVHLGCRRVGVAIRNNQLETANSRFRQESDSRVLTLFDVAASERTNQFGEPVNSLFSVVALRLLDGRTDIEGAAAMSGLGVQTLQRRLRREGLTYRGLVDTAKTVGREHC